ncbi:MAG: STAS domain-containing protein [Caldicoprobacterales bacterium]|jgi:anti-sigma B factor antagonist|nr:STAS domain-containing protein [Clostridiales bacterium]
MRIHHEGDAIYITIEGDVSFNNVQDIRKTILENFQDTDKNAVLNLSKVDFMDSSGLSIIITLLKRVKERGGELVLEYPQKPVQRILEISSLGELVEIRL